MRSTYAKRWLAAYVQAHGAPPVGRHDLGYTGFYNIHIGMVDFDELMEDREVKALLAPPSEDDIEDEVEDEAKCPVCDSETGCEHLVAVIDFQFCDIQAGALSDSEEPLDACIRAAFQAAHEAHPRKPAFYRSKRMCALYRVSEVEQKGEVCQVSIPPSQISRLVVDLLREAGAVGSIRELNQGPGWSTEVAELHAEDPVAVIERCRQLLRAELRIGQTSA